MVLLTMTPAVVTAVKFYNKHGTAEARDGEPSLANPVEGNPISHGQMIDVSRLVKERRDEITEEDSISSIYLNDLLKGCGFYVPPPPAKPDKSDEYKALMARLRVEEEAKAYTRMLSTDSPNTSMAHLSPTAGATHGYLFPPTSDPSSPEDDEVTYADINRQMALIANVLISILACSIGVWKVAWHWNVPERLALSMASSILVAAAEVAIYMGYIGRLTEAKEKERKKVEVRSVGESWVIEAKPSDVETDVTIITDEKTMRKDGIEAMLATGLRSRIKS